ncbi:MAG: hypothetical protein RIG63_12450 [Coleofasciculus chthonoplastes F3-SA18-01]
MGKLSSGRAAQLAGISRYLPLIAPIIIRLRTQGMWLTDKIIDDVLKLAAE